MKIFGKWVRLFPCYQRGGPHLSKGYRKAPGEGPR